jgi:hypothetical protein
MRSHGPVGAGLVDSLAQPGGNTTGFVAFEYAIAPSRRSGSSCSRPIAVKAVGAAPVTFIPVPRAGKSNGRRWNRVRWCQNARPVHRKRSGSTADSETRVRFKVKSAGLRGRRGLDVFDYHTRPPRRDLTASRWAPDTTAALVLAHFRGDRRRQLFEACIRGVKWASLLHLLTTA